MKCNPSLLAARSPSTSSSTHGFPKSYCHDWLHRRFKNGASTRSPTRLIPIHHQPTYTDLNMDQKKGEYIHPFPNERAANRRTFHAFIHSPHYDNNKLQPLLTNVIRQQEFSLTETQSNKFAFENDYHSHLKSLIFSQASEPVHKKTKLESNSSKSKDGYFKEILPPNLSKP